MRLYMYFALFVLNGYWPVAHWGAPSPLDCVNAAAAGYFLMGALGELERRAKARRA